MSSHVAMIQFCEILEKASALYTPYMEAQKRDKEEKERRIREELERKRREEERKRKEEEEERRRIAEEEERQRKLAEELARQKLAEEAEAQRIREEEIKRSEYVTCFTFINCLSFDMATYGYLVQLFYALHLI